MPSGAWPSGQAHSRAPSFFQRIVEKKMKQLTVAARLVLGFGIIIVLSFGIGVTAYVSATKLAADTEHGYRDGVLASQHLALAQTSLWELRFGVANYAALPKPEARRKIVAAGPTLFQTMDASLAEYRNAETSRP